MKKGLIINRIANKFNEMGKTKVSLYFIFLFITLIIVSLVLYGSIQLNIIQQEQLKMYPEGKGHSDWNNDWIIKGPEAFSWYLASITPLGDIAYYLAVIFGFISIPLLIFYISSFLIICFPIEKKQKNKNDKKIRNKKVRSAAKSKDNIKNIGINSKDVKKWSQDQKRITINELDNKDMNHDDINTDINNLKQKNKNISSRKPNLFDSCKPEVLFKESNSRNKRKGN